MTTIVLRRQQIKGHLELSFTPRTVRKVHLKGNVLTKINGLDRLAGKWLMWLDIRGNSSEIDLRLIEASPQDPNDNPLKVLRVNLCQISRSLLGKQYEFTDAFTDRVHQATSRWIDISVLDLIVIGHRAKNRYIWRKGQGMNQSFVDFIEQLPSATSTASLIELQ